MEAADDGATRKLRRQGRTAARRGARLTLVDDAGRDRVSISNQGSKGATGTAVADQAQKPHIGLMHMAGRPAGISVSGGDGNQKQLAL